MWDLVGAWRMSAGYAGAVAAAVIALSVSAGAGSAQAAGDKMTKSNKTMNIQEVQSPGGIRAWLVEEHSVPLIAMRFAFAGGSAQDPKGKGGLANFMTSMLDEGAGDLTAEQFQERMEDLAMRMSFQDGRDTFYGNFQSLTENRDKAADLLRLAITKPRFDGAAVDRIRGQLLANLAFAKKNPNRVAANAWVAAAFPNHPYGRPATGTEETVATITPADLEVYRKRVFARDHLKVAVVGDINAAQLGALLDKVFGDLPEKGDLAAVPAINLDGKGKLEVVDMPVPQSVVVFGMEGIKRKDPDFIPAFVMNHILGGGGFASRLMEEVREKRGLAYGVYSYLQYYDSAEFLAGQVATKNEKVAESIEVIRAELKRMADTGATAEDLANAQSYLTGSYALRFDTSSNIANQLLGIQLDGLGKDYVAKRNALIDAVTVDDVKRVAKRLLGSNGLIIAVAGRPKNLTGGG